MPSLVTLSKAQARDVGALVAPLMASCVEAPTDAYRQRLVHVVYAALLRPFGAQRNHGHVIDERCRLLREGGHLAELWRAVCPRRPHVQQQARHPPDPQAEATEKRRRRAVALVHAAEPGAARRTLESTSTLGELRAADVVTRGEHGEVIEAAEGSVAAEMLDKHPPPAEGETLPSLDELLRMTADHSSEALTSAA